jgi:hypothetical protein
MAIFEEVRFGWNGREYKIPPDQVMRLLAQIEDVVTMGDLYRYSVSGRPPLAKLATAYGLALRYAGANVSDEEIYVGMFKSKGKELQTTVVRAIQALLSLMVPPAALQELETAAKNAGAAAGSKSRSSPKRTRQQS